MTESIVRDRLHEVIEQDFQTFHEVRGHYLLESRRVRADLLCYPREHLCKRGFIPAWFVVETKHLDFAHHDSKRLYSTLWQAITYRHSEFIVETRPVRPEFAVLSVTDKSPDYSNAPEMAQRRRWEILSEFALYANVGYFRLDHSGGWAIYFGQGRYFDSTTGLNRIPRGLKRYVGSTTIHEA